MAIASAAAVDSSRSEAFEICMPREIADHGLEIEEGLHAALGDLGLVRRIGGVPAGVFENVAPDDCGQVRVGIAHADVGFPHAVAIHQGGKVREGGFLGAGCRKVERLLEPDDRRHRLVDELIDRGDADDFCHLGDVQIGRDLCDDEKTGSFRDQPPRKLPRP